MNVLRSATVAGMLCAILSMASCGGGSESGTGTFSTGASTPVVSSGTITDFGSIYINGRKYEIDDSTKTTQGDSTVTGDALAKTVLRRGMVVTVSGRFSGTTRMASTIIQKSTIEGLISTVDDASSRFVVLGQTVLVDDTTKFEGGLSLGSLNPNHIVEVSGFVKGDGIVAAGFIERKALSGGCNLGCEVKGTVKNHAHGTTSFQIGTLNVSYSGSVIDNSLPTPSGSNWNGLFVEVKGTAFDAGTTTLTATKVEREEFMASNGNQVELEGFVTSTSGLPIRFTLGTTTVQVTGSTLYLGGTIGEVAVGQKLEVQGSILNAVITATKVRFQDAVRIESNVTSKPTATSFTLDGLPGITVHVNSQTEFKNVANLAEIGLTSNVRIRGREGASNTVIATEVELRNASPGGEVIAQGVVQSSANPSLAILGVTIDTTSVSQFRDISDQPISRTGFFSALKPNTTVVKAKGDLFGISVSWKEMELESD